MTEEILLEQVGGRVRITTLIGQVSEIARSDLPEYLRTTAAQHEATAQHESATPVRWVWDSTALWYPELLRAGVRVERCHDLRLTRAILRHSTLVAESAVVPTDPAWEDWDGGWGGEHHQPEPEREALFAVAPPASSDPRPMRDCAQEWQRQRHLLAELARRSPRDAHRLRLLIAAECSAALAAVELRHDGLPFRADLHDATLTGLLGARPHHGSRPAHLEALAVQIRTMLGAPRLNPDSQPHLLRELRRNGLDLQSTNQWELARQDHPVIAPLLEYRKLSRLMSANGWAWLDTWVTAGRFRSEYVPAGVVTGRWSSRGGGALSLPKVIRSAVRADAGWLLVVVDAAQLEPRMLAAMSRDTAMLQAAARGDLYQALVDDGVVDTRAHAKVGMLAVLYGATSGQAAILLPRLARAYPAAMSLVEQAARTGEAGGVVTTWLGRSSSQPSASWQQVQQAASAADAGEEAQSRARSRAREWGRFTRNFVVQGTAAEWALAWIAGVRQGLAALGSGTAEDECSAEGGCETEEGRAPDAPRLAFFLHDELVVHTPAALAADVVRVLEHAAQSATRLLFPHVQADLVPLDVVVAQSYDEVDSVPDPVGDPEAGPDPAADPAAEPAADPVPAPAPAPVRRSSISVTEPPSPVGGATGANPASW